MQKIYSYMTAKSMKSSHELLHLIFVSIHTVKKYSEKANLEF